MSRHDLGALAPALRLFERQFGVDRAIAVLERALIAENPQGRAIDLAALAECLRALRERSRA